MCKHFRSSDFIDVIDRPPPVELFQKPSRYALVLTYPCQEEDHKAFVRHALRLVWTKINTAEYKRGFGQGKALNTVASLCHDGSVIAAIYPSRDVAETKIRELEAQNIYGHTLPARCIRVA